MFLSYCLYSHSVFLYNIYIIYYACVPLAPSNCCWSCDTVSSVVLLCAMLWLATWWRTSARYQTSCMRKVSGVVHRETNVCAQP